MSKKFLTSIDLSNNSLQNAKIDARWASTPSGVTNPDGNGTAVAGQLSTYSGAVYVFNGTAWVAVGNPLSDSTSLTSSTTGASSTAVKAAYDLANAALPKNGSGTMSGSLSMGNNKITGLAEPTTGTDAATKNYVDNVAQGVNAHDAVRALISGTIAGVYAGGTTTANPPGDGGTGLGATITYSATGATTVDTSVTLAQYDRVLVTGGVTADSGTTSKANGIYVVTTAGASGVATVLTRATDYDNSVFGDVTAGDLVYVLSGNTYGGTQWIQTVKGTATTGSGASTKYCVLIGTDSITFTQFSGNGAVPFATTSTAGIASFSSTYFTVSTGAVSLSSLGSLSTTGSAATLTTSRQIWGQGFDGSQPVTGIMTGVTSIQGTTGSTLAITQLAVSTGTANSISITSGQHTSSTGVGGSITLTGGAATTGTSTAAGGDIVLRGGNSNTSRGNGGSVYLYGGTGDASQTSGAQGGVYIGTTTTGLVSIGSSSNTSLTTDVYGTVNLHQVAPVSGTSFVKINYLQGQLSNATIAYSDLPTGTTLLSGQSSAVVSRKITGVGSGSGTSITVTHNIGSYVTAQLFDVTTAGHAYLVEVDIDQTDANTVVFTFATSQTLSNYRYVIIG